MSCVYIYYIWGDSYCTDSVIRCAVPHEVCYIRLCRICFYCVPASCTSRRLQPCFKCKTNVSCLVLEFSIHEQSEGALICLEHLAQVLISLTSLSGCCLYGSKTYFAWHRQKSCSRGRLGIYTDADAKSDCLRKGCWLENRLHEPCLPCLCRRSID